MDDLVPLDSYEDFASAASRARELAKKFQSPTDIQCNDEGWTVYVSPFVNAVHSVYGFGDYKDPFDPAGEEQRREEVEYQRRFLEDMQADEAAWARSRSSGWFYDDHDG